MAGGDFGLASGDKGEGKYGRFWYAEPVGAEEVAFESEVFLLTKAKAEQLRAAQEGGMQITIEPPTPPVEPPTGPNDPPTDPSVPPVPPIGRKTTLKLSGTVPPEVWNRLGTRILPKLRSGDGLSVGIEFSVSVDAGYGPGLPVGVATSSHRSRAARTSIGGDIARSVAILVTSS